MPRLLLHTVLPVRRGDDMSCIRGVELCLIRKVYRCGSVSLFVWNDSYASRCEFVVICWLLLLAEINRD